MFARKLRPAPIPFADGLPEWRPMPEAAGYRVEKVRGGWLVTTPAGTILAGLDRSELEGWKRAARHHLGAKVELPA